MNNNLLKKNCILLLFFLTSFFSIKAQSIAVSGRVTDDAGNGLAGVTVGVKGNASKAVVTDGTGAFSIPVATGKETLVFSYVGFTEQEIKLQNQTTLAVSLVPLSKSLEDVVVIGYGSVKRKDVTGAVAGINQKDIKSRPVTNALEAMQGKVAGVDITSSERPGTLGNITIRGVRSLTASNSPLFVVDGIPLITGGIESINPNDIETIDVLKDASATAIYGSRGANGVVIVTTKQGKTGRLTLNLNSSFRFENIVDREKMFNAADFITFRRWAYYYAGLNRTTGISTYPRGDQPNIANDRTYFAATADPFAWANIAQGWASGTWDGSKVATTDWRGLVKQQSLTSDNTISVSGGTDKIKAYGSFGYLNNTGTIRGQSFKRYSAKVNVDFAATKWLSFGNNISVTYSAQEYGQSPTNVATIGTPAGGLYESARGLFPYAVPYDSSGARILFPGGDNSYKNIVDEWNYNRDQRVTLRAFGSLYTQLNFGSIIPALKGLRYRLNFGPDFSSYRDGLYIDANSVANGGSTNYASLINHKTFSYTLDHLLYYDKTVGDHSFGLTLLQSQTAYTRDTSTITGNGIPLPSQLWNALSSGTVTGSLSTSSNIVQQQLLSYMARLNYSFKDKYLLTISARDDGASQLAEGHKYSLFPSAALAWRINKEKFMRVGWVDDLKLRIGAGVTGNSAIAPYSTQGAVTSLFYPFGANNTAGSIPNSILANKELEWEKTTQYNYGLDFSVFRRRVSGSIDYYTSKTTDLLMQRSIPTVTGFTTTFANVGKTANRGVDINITTVNINQKDLQWTTTINAAWQKDRIVTLSNGNQDDINNNWFIGQPVGVIYGYKSLGLWQAGDSALMKGYTTNTFSAGNVKVADLNGDNKIDPNNDRQIIGSTRPRWVVGMTNSINYKGFDLSIFLYGRLSYLYNAGGEGQTARGVTRQINYYTENNTNADFQKPIFNAGGAAQDPYFPALGYLQASFIKVRNISLGYTLGSEALGKSGVSSLKAYVQVANPGMLFSKIDYLDMDVVSPTYNRGITIGINASF
ncbi:SusC/RagA family TonB-linked outer membrane protein [Segetibacter aerophilus]|uniref:SusC/RagA family TonB-linked outer membrane protein n=1 Tax=Segetibacter aerophilus TaxID=670293 RepID=A0A512BJM8_9BACT|nr:TonB-dependent receptor [Segetibacter aerophilus]GEO12027.1 SusC/RagA family TonB-linked outer membrane protein [Segetibacter aerophilus]